MLNPDRRASVPGSHHISEANFWPESVAGLEFPPRVHLIDSTIRKTYFTAGNATTLDGYVRIAEALVELGVETTCLNVTYGRGTDPNPHDWELMTTILDARLPIAVNCWSDVFLGNGRTRGPVDPIEALKRFVDAGATMIAPGIVPAPDRDAELRQAEDLERFLEEAVRLGVTPTITLAGIGMRDFAQMATAARHAAEHGVARLDFMDSSNSLSPEATRAFVQKMRAAVGSETPITMHMHDEFGLATACAVAAASAGAHPDVSLNGMSYRCGFAPLEEVAISLELFYGIDTGLNLERIAHASWVVSTESQLPVPQLKPLTGEFAHLKHGAGDAAAAIRTGQDAFPPISHGLVPARMGSAVTWTWPLVSSDDLVRTLAGSIGLTLRDDEVTAVRVRMDAAVEAIATYPRWLEPEEATALLRASVADLRGEWLPPTVIVALRVSLREPGLIADARAALAERGLTDHQAVDVAAVRSVVGEIVAALPVGRLVDLATVFRLADDGDGNGRGEADLLAAIQEYERHFGFPPVAVTGGIPASDLASSLRAATATSPATELARVRAVIAAKLDARIVRIGQAPRG